MPKLQKLRPATSLGNLKERLHPYKHARTRFHSLQEYQKLWVQDKLDRVDGLQGNNTFINQPDTKFEFDQPNNPEFDYPSSEASTEILPQNLPQILPKAAADEKGKVILREESEDEREDMDDKDENPTKKAKAQKAAEPTKTKLVNDSVTSSTLLASSLGLIAVAIALINIGYTLMLIISVVMFFAPVPVFLPRWSLAIPLVLPLSDKARFEVASFLVMLSWVSTMDWGAVAQRLGKEAAVGWIF